MRIRNTVGIAVAAIALILVGTLWFFYSKYSRLADEKLAQGPFPKSSRLFAAPDVLGVGDAGSRLQIAGRLRESGYSEDSRSNSTGWYHLRPDGIEIFPGPGSFVSGQPGLLRFAEGKISSIVDLSDNSERTEFTMEPQLLSALYNKSREKRRLVRYRDIPPVMVHALISAEDKRFFQHSGLDPIRIVKAMLVDVRQGRNAEGASTLTQQLARMLWLDNRKTFGRKFAELMITLHLEHTLTKEQIFEYYFNQYDLGRRDSFEILGFGEAAQAYFGKDISQLNLPEAATLAGMVQSPSYRNPVRWPERARTRRNIVLRMMMDNGYITPSQHDVAVAAPVIVSRIGSASADAPYFVDMVNEQLTDQFEDKDFQGSESKIYTTIDPELQRDAGEAVVAGMKEVDSILARRNKDGQAFEQPQVALICLDPHTGEIKALVGGRNYGASQLNHAVAKRPSGSIFKPFVYATALNTSLWDHPNPITTSTIFSDEPQTFIYGGKSYSPVDFHKGDWKGDVTVREALAESLNVPAVEVAQAVGFDAVAQFAHKAGLPEIRPTPAEALGAYDVTPMEMAGAYTTFANGGVRVSPRMISKIVDKEGRDVWRSEPESKSVLDPRVNYLLVSLMQQVLRSGTGARVWSYGFNLPAAGKTGTSHDAWFAGFTSKLLCIVWVGLDDYQDLKVEGAHAALPVWAEFMKRAHRHRAYRAVSDFAIPEGVVSAQVDATTGLLATGACPKVITDFYIMGTQPVQFCSLHAGGATEIAGWGDLSNPAGNPNDNPAIALPVQPAANIPPPPGTTPTASQPLRKKSGFFDKVKSIFQ